MVDLDEPRLLVQLVLDLAALGDLDDAVEDGGSVGADLQVVHGCAAMERREMEERIRSLSAGVFIGASLVAAADSSGGAMSTGVKISTDGSAGRRKKKKF